MQVNIDDPEVFKIVGAICRQYAVGFGTRSERLFLDTLLSTYEGAGDIREFEEWLNEEIPAKFPAIGNRPEWLQSAEWPFLDATPMVFVGQIDIGSKNSPQFHKYFHDFTSFYVFMPQVRGSFVVIMQQM